MEAHLAEERRTGAVVRWRHEQLVAAGFPPPLAAWIAARRSFDLHALIELVERGCPPSVAVRIAMPDEADAA